ncbi:hypothetical protein AAH678_28295 [Sodalis endosymbiont of Spalangia cameroni]|uniref:hypothetical protein n=1 Tax=Sodalis praecaptivus TaxID=1239307 RepID=UPI0031F9EAB5
MRTDNLNTAAQEPSERYGKNRQGARGMNTCTFSGASAHCVLPRQDRVLPFSEGDAYTNCALSVSQITDLFCFITEAAPCSTGTLLPPKVPDTAEYLCAVFAGSADSIAVWLVDGWPVAASDELCLVHWSLLDGQ